MKTCENCGCRVYALGCVNCDEAAYIEAQAVLDDYDAVERACKGCMGPCGRCHEVEGEPDALPDPSA